MIDSLRDDLLKARVADARSQVQLPVESMTVELTITAAREPMAGRRPRCRSWRWELGGASAGKVDCVSFGKGSPFG